MIKKKKKVIRGESEVYTVGYLRSVAWQTLKNARESEKGRLLNCMASVVFSAFTLEAYCNYLGEKKISFWSIIERNLSVEKKLEIIASQMGIKIDYGCPPFQSLKFIFKVRDLLAHGKTEIINHEDVQILTDEDMPKLKKAKWQELITFENAELYLEETKKMIEYLHEASGLDFNPLYTPEIVGYREYLIDEKG